MGCLALNSRESDPSHPLRCSQPITSTNVHTTRGDITQKEAQCNNHTQHLQQAPAKRVRSVGGGQAGAPNVHAYPRLPVPRSGRRAAAAASAWLGTRSGDIRERRLSEGAEDEEHGGERSSSATGGGTTTANNQLLGRFRRSGELIILKVPAASSLSKIQPGRSPCRGWMHAATSAKCVFLRMMAGTHMHP